MLIVDAQVHIWANNKPTNPNHRQVENYSKDDLLREMRGSAPATRS
jgi:predicted TIM-barrel fold metal-dependent hydrolase